AAAQVSRVQPGRPVGSTACLPAGDQCTPGVRPAAATAIEEARGLRSPRSHGTDQTLRRHTWSGRVSDLYCTLFRATLRPSAEGARHGTSSCALPALSHRPGHAG